MSQWGASLSAAPVDGLAVDVVVRRSSAVLKVRGDVDVVTAPMLGALIGALIDQRHHHLTIEAAGIGFMDAAGLRVVAATLNRLAPIGGQLAIANPTAAVTRILRITDLADRVGVHETQLGEEQATDPLMSARQTEPGVVADVRRISAMPANRDVIDAALDLVVELAQGGISMADGVSVSLRRHGRFATVASSDETATRLDDHQYDTGQGPCVAAARAGQPFYIGSVHDEHRWPAFTPHALDQGMNSILSMPLTSDAGPVGSLNLYARQAHAFDDGRHERAATFATAASAIVAVGAPDLTDEDIAVRIQDALRAREVIAHAEGVLMGREGITAAQAYTRLRRLSQTTSVTLVEHARQVVQATGQEVSNA